MKVSSQLQVFYREQSLLSWAQVVESQLVDLAAYYTITNMLQTAPKCTRLEVKCRKVSKVFLKILLSQKFIFSSLLIFPSFVIRSYINLDVLMFVDGRSRTLWKLLFQLLFPQPGTLITSSHLYWVLDRYSLCSIPLFLFYLLVILLLLFSLVLAI